MGTLQNIPQHPVLSSCSAFVESQKEKMEILAWQPKERAFHTARRGDVICAGAVLPHFLALICSSLVSSNYCPGTFPKALSVCETQLDTFCMARSPGWMNITSRTRSLAQTLNSLFYECSETLASVLLLNFSVGQLICKNVEENTFRKKEKYIHLCPDFQNLLNIGLAFPGGFKCIFSVALYKNILYQNLVLETFMVTFL